MCDRIVLPGGSGFLGRTLARWFSERGADVVVLTRGARLMEHGRVVRWDAATPGDWTREIDGAAAVINLAGRSVNCRYHARNRREIMDSRILSTRVLGRAIAACDRPPPVWLNSSTATIYKHTYGASRGEKGEIGATPEVKDAFSIEVARAWEAEFEAAVVPVTRKVVLRAAMVFGREPGGVYEVLRRLTRLRLGGRMGHGRQYVSWMHADDFCRAIEWLIERPASAGVYNLAAPNPLTNAEMMRTLRGHLGVSLGLPAARWMLEVGAFVMRTETELIIKSRRVVPERLLREGFEFRYPDLFSAVAALENTSGNAATRERG